MDFKLKDGEVVRTVKAVKDSATVIEAGDIVALSSGLIVKAGASDARIAYAPYGAGAGETLVDVTIGNDFTLYGANDADANFAATQRGATCDLKVNAGAQLVDNDTQSTNVFRIGLSQDAGTVGSKANVEVRIALPLF